MSAPWARDEGDGHLGEEEPVVSMEPQPSALGNSYLRVIVLDRISLEILSLKRGRGWCQKRKNLALLEGQAV